MLCVQDTCNDLYTNRNLWNTAYNLDVTISTLSPLICLIKVVSLDVTGGGLGMSADSEGKLRLWQTDTGEVRVRNKTGSDKEPL